MRNQTGMLSSSCELSGHLFDSVPAFLPDLEDNETLFSWAGRYHRRSGNARIQETSRALFGDSAAGLHHDFPSHVTHLAKCFGTANIGEQLVFKHTIFGAIAKFLDRKTVLSSLSMMLGPSVTGLKQKIGLLKGGVGAANPLKACWECIAADTQTSSGPIWHLEHQWPSVLVCRKHWLPLVYLAPRAERGSSRLWLLPDSVEKSAWLQLPSLSDRQLNRLQRLAAITAKLAAIDEISFDLSCLRLAYLLGAKARGFIVTSDGSTRYKQLVKAVRNASADIEGLPGWAFLTDTKSPHGGFVGFLLRQCPGNRHLNKHVTLIDFLFDSFEQFSAGYGAAMAAANAGTLDELVGELHSTRHQVLHRVSVEGSSINQAAEAAGVAVSQAVKWIQRAGISYKARPRVLDQLKTSKLLEMLSSGRSREEIIEQLGIKKSWLRNFLALNIEIRDQWQESRELIQLEQYRGHFLMLLERHAGTPIKRIKAIPGSGFSWLYNHDRAWLTSRLPRVR